MSGANEPGLPADQVPASRPRLAWDDLRTARVGVWGLGREGQANLRKLATLGVDPVLADDHPVPGGSGGREGVLATDDGGLDALAKCDVVVKTPGISRYRPEVAALVADGVTVTGGLGLWLAGADLDRVVCVTGTKGKSTTASVIGHLLTGFGHPCMIGGNIGASPWDPGNDGQGGLGGRLPPADQGGLGGRLPPDNRVDFWVIEVSSYQATDLPCSPPVVAVTSLHPDHLDWHGGVEQYYRDKLSVCTQPGAELTVANGDSELLRERRDLLGPRVEWVRADDDPDADWMLPLGLLGPHNRRNALIARHCLLALGIEAAGDYAALERAAAGYHPLPSRLTTVGAVQGVVFVDDSLSTNVLPTLAALDAFPSRRIALLVGGHDRGIDYAPLAAGLRDRAGPTLVLTLPDNGPRIHVALEAGASPVVPGAAGPGGSGPAGLAGTADSPGSTVEVRDCAGLDEAVIAGFRWARPDGVVLLSPAAPSFGQFRDYRDRGDAFARAVASLRPLCLGARRAAGRAR
jgi:UDP-N-acetylmuramoylalanine--D-glutamate ligase